MGPVRRPSSVFPPSIFFATIPARNIFPLSLCLSYPHPCLCPHHSFILTFAALPSLLFLRAPFKSSGIPAAERACLLRQPSQTQATYFESFTPFLESSLSALSLPNIFGPTALHSSVLLNMTTSPANSRPFRSVPSSSGPSFLFPCSFTGSMVFTSGYAGSPTSLLILG